ncbi:class I SAM-dependent methyltransferase [Chloroflexota bacterium]
MDDYGSHPGGNPQYWMDNIVREYEYQQHLVSEQKEESLHSMVRIINYFRYLYGIGAPRILDIGCGPGTATTLAKNILEQVPDSYVTGVDSSEQMITVANSRLIGEYGQRFNGYVSDFNNQNFWLPEINRRYDFLTSFAALHYLSDSRMFSFLGEIFDHLENNGVFVLSMANRSMLPRIAEMENQFRIEFTYNQLEPDRRPPDFRLFKTSFEETDSKANINWHSYREWLELIQDAGFREVELVSHLWIRTTIVALK